MIEPAIISSDFRRKMKIHENGERLVDLRTECPDIVFEIAEYLNADGEHLEEFENAHFARETVARRVTIVQDSLPTGFRLLVRCAYRTPEVQARQYTKGYRALMEQNPTWSAARLDAEIEKRIDPPDVGPHCAGGAVDVSIVGEDGKQLDMGTGLDVFNRKAYTHSEEITEAQKANRQILINAMLGAGFFDFPTEWWHWSYGEREWAHAYGEKAIYGPIENLEVGLEAEPELFGPAQTLADAF